ncbi:MAG: biopolymer transporter ExbD [bacterium]|nr:biopolymer transporter ExbD [bacterium]
MRIKTRHHARAVIPTASMADIAFLLIVFFMVTISFEKDKTQVALPRTELRLEVPKIVAYVSVTQDGFMRVTDGEDMSVPVQSTDDVLTFAAGVVSTFPGRPIILKGDTDVPYEKIDKIIDALKQAKVETIYLLSDQVRVDEASGG